MAPTLLSGALAVSRARPMAGPSSRASFSFFNKPPPPTASKLLDELSAARQSERLDLISKLYPTLYTSLTTGRSTLPASGAHSQLQAVMAFVGTTSRLSLLLRMFADLPTLGLTQTAADHSLVLSGLARNGTAARARAWIEGMQPTFGVRPSARDWNVVAGAYRRESDLEGMRSILGRMREAGTPPTVVSYNQLVAALFEAGQAAQAADVRAEMDREGVEADVWTETTLLSGFVDAGDLDSAARVHARLAPRGGDLAALNALAKYACASQGLEAGVRLVEGYRAQGVALDELSLTTLAAAGAREGLEDATAGIALIEQLEQSTGLAAGRKAWSLVLNGVLAGPGGVVEAQKVLQEARDRSVAPDSALVHPVLSALLAHPTPERFAAAKAVYEDLASSSRAYSTAPDTSVYVTLLRACAHPASPDLEFSKTLLADMRERSVKLDAPSVTWHIVALMRVAADFPSAFAAYDTVRALDATLLDTPAYNTILAAFTSLTFPSLPIDSQIAPPPLILEFLSDMRRTSHPPDSITYSLLLTYYSRTSTASPALIAHLHSLLKLDTHVDPDTPLFNALMGAYSRVGAHHTAFRVWDTLRANGQHDEVSVSTVLDACGFANEPRRAHRTWDALRRDGFALNLKNWESWVECLARLGELPEAERVVFEDMAIGSGVEARATTVETLLKFSRREKGRWEAVRERVQRERPDVWERVKDVAVGDEVPPPARGEAGAVNARF